LLNSTTKLAVSIVILLLTGSAAPLTANALMPNKSVDDGMFLPVPHQLLTTPYHGMSTSMPDPNSIQVPPSSNQTSTPIQHRLLSTSPSNMNTSTSNPNGVQFLPSSNLNIRNGSNSSNNSGSSSSRTPFGFWNPIFAVAPFLNIPKNLIVPPVCQLNVCPTIVGTQRGDIIIATAVNNARIFGLGGNDVIECGIGNCNVFTAFGNNVLMSGPAFSAHLYAGSGGFLRPGNNIFIGAGGQTLMVGGNGNDQFYAGSNNLFDGGNDIMIGGSGANYFDCGPNGNGIILDFNPAKGDTKAPNCRYVITTYQNNIFGPGIPDNITGQPITGQSVQTNQSSLSGQNSTANQPNNAGLTASLSGLNSNANQPNNAGLMGSAAVSGLSSGLNSNANQPNYAGIMGLLSGQNSNAKQPNLAGIMGLLSGQNSNAKQPNLAGIMATPTGSGKPGVMARGYPS
jgi:hypothetical protein